jgi:hypothetical protein
MEDEECMFRDCFNGGFEKNTLTTLVLSAYNFTIKKKRKKKSRLNLISNDRTNYKK